jgi:hypothetical protein
MASDVSPRAAGYAGARPMHSLTRLAKRYLSYGDYGFSVWRSSTSTRHFWWRINRTNLWKSKWNGRTRTLKYPHPIANFCTEGRYGDPSKALRAEFKSS